MSGFRLTPEARNDLFEIWDFIASDNPIAANNVEAAIFDACAYLAKGPLLGAVRTDLTALPLRFWLLPSFPNYFIVYDPNSDPLRIIRVLHRARNIPSILSP